MVLRVRVFYRSAINPAVQKLHHLPGVEPLAYPAGTIFPKICASDEERQTEWAGRLDHPTLARTASFPDRWYWSLPSIQNRITEHASRIPIRLLDDFFEVESA